MKAIAIALVLVFSACCNFRPPPTPLPVRDANCAGACAHLQKLGCEEGDPLPDGTTCTEFCERTQEAGHALRPSCMMQLKSCAPEEMEKCQGPRQVFDD